MNGSPLATFEWGGQTRYKCPECHFDGPTEHSVAHHWRGTHAKGSSQPSGSLLFDKDDKPLQRVEAPELPEWLRTIEEN